MAQTQGTARGTFLFFFIREVTKNTTSQNGMYKSFYSKKYYKNGDSLNHLQFENLML